MSAVIRASVPVPPGAEALVVRCEECEAGVRFVVPVDLRSFSHMVRAFEDCHAECVLDRQEAEESGVSTASTEEP